MKKVPYIASDYKLLFKPEQAGNYINDHSIVQDKNGGWHLFGITSHYNGAGHPSHKERYFVHGVSEKLISDGGMTESGIVIDNGSRAWAPGVYCEDGKYYMYFGPSPTKMAVSIDMYEWMEYEINMLGTPMLSCHRDHFVMKLNDYTYIMYVVGVKDGYGAVSCLVSNDMINWRFVQYALTSGGNAPLKPAWGAFESPFVVKRDGTYYMFVTYTDCETENYNNTLVFSSTNPYDFGHYTGDNHNEIVVAEVFGHASEIITDGDKEYITTCGWRGKNVPIEGAVAIAELKWI